jgi:predicted GNAT family N-acyltransferase
MRHNLTLTETLHTEIQVDAVLLTHAWEVGRLVMAPEFRSGPDFLKQCLSLALVFLCSNAQVENLHASCSHVLSRLYRRFGFAVLAKDIPLPGTEKTYTVIHGHVSQVSKALAIHSDAGQSTSFPA